VVDLPQNFSILFFFATACASLVNNNPKIMDYLRDPLNRKIKFIP